MRQFNEKEQTLYIKQMVDFPRYICLLHINICSLTVRKYTFFLIFLFLFSFLQLLHIYSTKVSISI